MLVLLLVAAFLGLGYRLVNLQVVRHEELKELAAKNTERRFYYEPRRGNILDVKGNLLASSTPVKMVCADPTVIGNCQAEVARVLAPLLDLDETKLVQSLMPRPKQKPEPDGTWGTNQFVRLKQKVSLDTWEKIQQGMRNLFPDADLTRMKRADREALKALRTRAIFANDEQLREYPSGALAAHVLGYTSPSEKVINGGVVQQLVGMDGIERMFDQQLSGVRGWRTTEIDNRKRELVVARNEDVQPADGLNVVLTIDSVIQHIVEIALVEAWGKLSPSSICAVVVRPRTGEILAMATVPNFDPNRPGDAGPHERRNRVITDVAEPGSTFKIVPISGALNDKTVRLTDMINCEGGHFRYGGRILDDHEEYNMLTVEGVVAKSSNIGAAKIALMMGDEKVYQYVRNFGFGVRTGIPLPGEVVGTVHPISKWSKVTIVQMPMGHGLDATRLQMTMAMCAVANDGWLMRPMLVQRLEDPQGRVLARYSPQRVRQVIKPEAARLMTQALKAVVSADGTAPKAALEHYTVAGKTGTARKVENGEYVRKYFASFIGFLPADNPEVCIAVSIDEPPARAYYGGQTAAPIFKQIAERIANYLNVRPEENPADPQPGSLAAPANHGVVQSAAARSLLPNQKERRP